LLAAVENFVESVGFEPQLRVELEDQEESQSAEEADRHNPDEPGMS
jgi:hypothetical protein